MAHLGVSWKLGKEWEFAGLNVDISSYRNLQRITPFGVGSPPAHVNWHSVACLK